jgi:hypothetical protein
LDASAIAAACVQSNDLRAYDATACGWIVIGLFRCASGNAHDEPSFAAIEFVTANSHTGTAWFWQCPASSRQSERLVAKQRAIGYSTDEWQRWLASCQQQPSRTERSVGPTN